METKLTNSPMEAVNGLLQLAKRIARGFRNFHYLRLTGYLKAGGLNLQTPQFLPTGNFEEPVLCEQKNQQPIFVENHYQSSTQQYPQVGRHKISWPQDTVISAAEVEPLFWR